MWGCRFSERRNFSSVDAHGAAGEIACWRKFQAAAACDIFGSVREAIQRVPKEWNPPPKMDLSRKSKLAIDWKARPPPRIYRRLCENCARRSWETKTHRIYNRGEESSSNQAFFRRFAFSRDNFSSFSMRQTFHPRDHFWLSAFFLLRPEVNLSSWMARSQASTG